MKISVFCFVFSLFYSIKSTNGTSSRIKLENNGYSGILISIDSDVPEDPSILTMLQKHISDASKALYIATKKRAYFKDVSILLPDTWSDMSKYTDASWEWHYRTDVAISKGLNSTEVESFGGCGIKGKRMVLPSRLIFHQQEWRDRFGNIAKTLVHEWAKFRWGVFEEYSTKAKNQFYFSTTTNNIESTRCTVGLQGAIYKKQNQTKIPCPGVNSTTGRYDNDCQFFPYVTKDKNGERSSIMDRYYVSEIDEFCDDSNHNLEAPNKHNMLCEGKSTWDIIGASGDFVNGVNPVRNIADGDLVPIFNIVKAKTRKIVLVLDTSGSLLFFQRGRRMVQIVHEYLEEWVKNGYEVGLIEFNIKVRVLQPLTKINSKDDRQLFIDKLKAITFRSYTNIGGGLTEAIVMLEENKADATGGHVILFSDGSEDEKAIIPDPNWSITPLNETIPNLVDAGVVVDTVLLTESADDKMLNVSHSTGGSLYFDSYDDSSSAMLDAFLDIGSRD
ncbi:unnamed protein product [Owenia fusiformis]|uniref:VWFA domain-containing protein n=1 Tax=Owenia fusiformis TaxID=6347 RepID=A0A8S4PNJ4_OWEFU|nr:unnamed protein product [Owenia fusiformis]